MRSHDHDPNKSAANKIKHGIDFDEAQEMWSDERLVLAPASTDDEPRFLAIATIRGKHWSAVCGLRGDQTRIISVRRSRPEEIEFYEST